MPWMMPFGRARELAPAGDDLDIPDFLRRHAEENGGTEPNAMQAREGAAA
jgi:hypothetical protein